MRNAAASDHVVVLMEPSSISSALLQSVASRVALELIRTEGHTQLVNPGKLVGSLFRRLKWNRSRIARFLVGEVLPNRRGPLGGGQDV